MGELAELDDGVIWHDRDQWVMVAIDLTRGPKLPDGKRHVGYRFTRTITFEGDDFRSVDGPVVTIERHWIETGAPKDLAKVRGSAVRSFHRWLHEKGPPRPRGLMGA